MVNKPNHEDLQRFDQSIVTGAQLTDEGYLRATAVVSRIGVFKYFNEDGTVRNELRHPDDVFNATSLDSLKMRPITNGHPNAELVGANNAKELSIGYTGESVNTDGKFLVTSLLITDKDGVQAVESGRKQELSLGYQTELIPEEGVYNGERYDYRQTNIVYNHLAIVERGRAGAEARINFDSLNSNELVVCDNNYITSIKSKMESKNMAEDKFVTVILDGLEYKSMPEVAKAYEKIKDSFDKKSAKFDSLNDMFEKLKGEKEDLKKRVDILEEGDTTEEVREAVEERVEIIMNASELLVEIAEEIGDLQDSEEGEDASESESEGEIGASQSEQEINLDKMSNAEIMKTLVKKKCPKVKLDGASEVYIKARFDALVENIDKSRRRNRSSIASQRRSSARRFDKSTRSDSRSKMIERLVNRHKSDKGGK